MVKIQLHLLKLKFFPALNMNFVPKCEPTAFHTIYFSLLIFLLYLHERSAILQSLSGSSNTYRVISNRFVAYQLPGSKLKHELEVRALLERQEARHCLQLLHGLVTLLPSPSISGSLFLLFMFCLFG